MSDPSALFHDQPWNERLVSRGGIPVQAYQTMKVPYMEGDFSFPDLWLFPDWRGHRWPREWIGEGFI